jgi:excinuclease ABC subunit A
MPATSDPQSDEIDPCVRVFGTRVHNLRGVDVTAPRDALVAFTGISGSGKSSLAFETLYAEGQRRYVESRSACARQLLARMVKPDVDLIEGLSPAISARVCCGSCRAPGTRSLQS